MYGNCLVLSVGCQPPSVDQIDECLRVGICHRDVKPANLLYPRTTPSSAPEGVVLADMGMAARAGSDGRVKGRYVSRARAAV